MYKRLFSFFLLTASFSFANEANANLGPIMASAATNQMIKMLPLFILAIGIAFFFTLIQKHPQQAVLGCGGLSALAFIIGIITWFLEFIASHAFVFIFLSVTLLFVGLIAYMVYSPPNTPKTDEEDDSTNKKNPLL